MYESYNPYGMYNPYYNYNQQLQQLQMQKQQQQQSQQMYKPQNPIGLQGKVVDSLDVVKATDIPYDGSVSYFPLTDSSAIITKQLQQDGTSKLVIYKPISDADKDTPKYVTEKDFKEQIQNINSEDIKDIKENIQALKKQLDDVANSIKYKKEKR